MFNIDTWRLAGSLACTQMVVFLMSGDPDCRSPWCLCLLSAESWDEVAVTSPFIFSLT